MDTVNLSDSLHLKTNPTLERIFMLLEEGDFWRADNLCSQILDQLPRCAEAYVGKLMAEIQICIPEDFLTTNKPFTTSNNYQHAISYSIDPLRNFLIFAPYENFYLRGVTQMQSAGTEAEFLQAGEIFKSISTYKDSSERIRQCHILAEISRKNAVYDRAISSLKLDQISSLKSAIADFESIPGWKDVDRQVVSCKNKLHQLEAERKKNLKRLEIASIIICTSVIVFFLVKNFVIPPISIQLQYNRAVSLMNNEDYHGAISAFKSLNGYKDSNKQIEACTIAIEDQLYEEAISLYQEEKYTEAISAFQSLDGYKDSNAQIQLCEKGINDQKYDSALILYSNGNYEQAIIAFTELNGYKDSLAQIELCQTAIKDQKYNEAFTLYSNGNFEDAITAFQALNGYKDSRSQIDACKTAIKDQEYDAALVLYTAGDYLSAYPALIALSGYKDSTEKANSIYREYKLSELRNANVRDYVLLGTYEQDNKTSRKEDIEWQILVKESDRVLLISRYALDCQRYDTSNTLYSGVFVTWETCSLRKWLNNTFIGTAFSSVEQEMILSSTVTADSNPETRTESGNNTVDKVFLLSANEANKYSSDGSRSAKPTAFAQKGDLFSDFHPDSCNWWLRTPGLNNAWAATVSAYGGRIDLHGNQVDDLNTMVRPALWISLN